MDYTRNWLKRNPENFPVASRLLPPEAREPLAAFYAFARGADNIADNGKVAPERRHKQLLDIEDAFKVGEIEKLPFFARDFAVLAQSHPPLMSYARDLLSAFVQDTLKPRYRDYVELIDYCHRSAVPVGRVMLYVCGEQHANTEAADALSTALQLLNHIQDCSDDYVNRGRVYLPLDWFTLAKAEVKMLAASESTPELRAVLDRGLEKCSNLLKKAEKLPISIDGYRMRAEVTWILLLARALCGKLKHGDPLAKHVRIGILGAIWQLIIAAMTAI